jgi:hypothetical protein
MERLMSIEARRKTAHDFCEHCEYRGELDCTRVLCKAPPEPRFIPLSVGSCPIGLWEHSKIEPPPPKPPDPNKAAPGEYKLCKHRLKEEWDAEWREKILASVLRTTTTCYFIPVAVWEEMKPLRR